MPDWTNLVFALRQKKTHLADSAADAIEFLEARNEAMKKAYLELCNNYSHGKDTWISCEEQLPEKGELVLTAIYGSDIIRMEPGETLEECLERQNNGCNISISFLDEDGLWTDGYFGGPEVIAPSFWMPFPKEPEK